MTEPGAGGEAVEGGTGDQDPVEPSRAQRRAARSARVRRRRRIVAWTGAGILAIVAFFALWYELESHALGSAGQVIDPEGVRHQIHGNVIQSTSRVLKEKVTFSDIAVTSRDWGSYPLLTFPELPAIDVLMVPRPEDEPLGVGESTSVPSAAAIANAIFDATGVRFREPPFTPDRILKGLREAGFAEEAPRETSSLAIPAAAPASARRRLGPLSRRRSERLGRSA